MMELGMHTDNWRVLSGNFRTAVDSAVKYGLSHIEFGVIHGQYFINGLGYDPAVSLQSNPRALRRYLDQKGLRVSQIDGAYPLMGPDGSTFGVQYVQQAIRFAAELGCPIVDTTDGAFEDRRLQRRGSLPHCLRELQAVPLVGRRLQRRFSISRPHGPYTTDADFMERLFAHFDSEYLRMNFDTGNTFISGHDPLEYLKRFPQVPRPPPHQGREPGLGGGRSGRRDGHRL